MERQLGARSCSLWTMSICRLRHFPVTSSMHSLALSAVLHHQFPESCARTKSGTRHRKCLVLSRQLSFFATSKTTRQVLSLWSSRQELHSHVIESSTHKSLHSPTAHARRASTTARGSTGRMWTTLCSWPHARLRAGTGSTAARASRATLHCCACRRRRLQQ